jgi:hypothetical protein
MSEAELLEWEARRARRGLREAGAHLKRDVETALDASGVVRDHPLISLGAGAAAGYVVGGSLAHSGRRRGIVRAAGGTLKRIAGQALRVAILGALIGHDGDEGGDDAEG